MNSIQNNFIEPTRHSFLLSSSSFMEPYHKVQNSNQMSSINEKKIGEVWSKHNFDTDKVKVENLANLSNVPAVWGASRRDESGEGKTTEQEINENAAQNLIKTDDSFSETGDQMEDTTQQAEPSTPDHEEISPSHHARRPPNAFLIFCKKHRPIVRQRYPTTENRGVTKILGEWWALLNAAEKQPYNDLAKEYKDAFLSANPDFRWYKLPAPPLRTLTTRPTIISKPVPTISSPPPTLLPSEFTPGKLADESQLGGLTSLMNNNYTLVKKDDTYCCKAEDNNNEDPDIQTIPPDTDKILADIFSSPTNTITATMPPKPIKKRFFEHHEEEKNCSKKIFDENSGDMTHQELLNKVVDNIYANDKEEPREQRKSDRMCKGKRYELFMVEGKLLGHKRDSKLTQHNRYSRIDSKIEQELSHTKHSSDPPKLENTIKRLAKRTNVKIDFESEESKQKQTETTTDSTVEKSSTINFNLDMRIDNLDSLNYDDFIKRKRESKKRKMKIKSDVGYKIHQRADNNNVSNKPEATPVVGSKKRKNKQSITHLNKTEPEGGLAGDNALLGLATLAMVAASTEKIGENSST